MKVSRNPKPGSHQAWSRESAKITIPEQFQITNSMKSATQTTGSSLWPHLRYNLVQKAAVQVTVQAFLQIREKFTMSSGRM